MSGAFIGLMGFAGLFGMMAMGVPVGLALLVAVLCFDIIGNGLRALTDPRGGRA